MNAYGEPCPVCGRVDGGHDQTMHDMAGKPPTK